jgi:hypothetical protein
MIFLVILASGSQPTTRCHDANNGWHGRANGGGDEF